MEIKLSILGVCESKWLSGVVFWIEKILQNHMAVQVQRDNFLEHVNGETIPPHAVLQFATTNDFDFPV